MNILSRIIHEQNKVLLEKMANDIFSEDEDKKKFITKYHKLNYAHLNTVKKDNIESYKKKYEKFNCVKKE